MTTRQNLRNTQTLTVTLGESTMGREKLRRGEVLGRRQKQTSMNGILANHRTLVADALIIRQAK
jgi:hypothetical protein